MCDICVIRAVKEKMLSRRDLFRGAAAVTAAAAAATVAETASAPPALAAGHSRIQDMTHDLHHDFPTYFGGPTFDLTQLYNWDEHKFNMFEIKVNEHTGTHVDAPLHFSENGAAVNEIPVENLVQPLCVVDIKARAAEDPDTLVTPDDIRAWIAANGDIPDNACVAMNSGWDALVATPRFRGTDDDGGQHYPGFHVEAAQMLMEETGAMSIGVDTLSLDHGQSADFKTHYAWLPTGRYGIENISNLDLVPAAGATIVVGAPKHRGGSGGQSRVFALI